MLFPCPSCRRHVRPGDLACPFCESALPEAAPAPSAPPRLRGLGRAAIFALGATIGGASLSGCPAYGGPPEPLPDSGPATDSGPDDDGGSMALYGGAPADGG